MDISQMRKINEMTRVLQQHRIAPDAQAAYAQSEAFFLHTNDRMSPQEPQVILEHPQEQFSGTEVSLGVMHENHERLENFERKTQEKIVSLEDDVAHIINKVNELIQVMKSLEEKREKKEIGNSLEAEVELTLSKNQDVDFLKSFKDDLPGLLLVSRVSVLSGNLTGTEEIKVAVAKAPGQKCERCWNYRETVGNDREYATLCHRCVTVLKGA